MKFGTFGLDDVEGAVLAHSLSLLNGEKLKKGIIITATVIEQLRTAAITSVIAAIPEEGDVLEDQAASRIAASLAHPSLRVDTANTGRVNFFAASNGLFEVSREAIDAINAIDPGITLATLHDKEEVNEGRMVATIKIIPYGLPASTLAAVENAELENAIRVTGFKSQKIGLVQTVLAGTKPGVLDKTRRTLERRLERSGSVIVQELRVEHTSDAVAEGVLELPPLCDLVIAFGASANSDIRDVIPAGLTKAGGRVIRFGMPVDPGNLLVLGTIEGKTVIGAPGCARSPAENGFDWVLQQVLAEFPPETINIAGMGVGGLLMETGARPHPRLDKGKAGGKVAAIILAAGQSRRMGRANKMTVEIDGKPMVRHVADAVSASEVDRLSVVTGHEPQETHNALYGVEVEYVHNPDFADGLSTSLAAGVSALDDDVDHAIILLGDMPFIAAEMINALVRTGKQTGSIVMATCEGKRGNPVLWPRRFFNELTRIDGDIGARHLIGANADQLVEVEIGTAAALDLDTPEAVAAAKIQKNT